MYVSYKKLWKILIDRDMKKKDLYELAGVSPASITKMGKGGHVTTEILQRICLGDGGSAVGRDGAASTGRGGDLEGLLHECGRDAVSFLDVLKGVGSDLALILTVHSHGLDVIAFVGSDGEALVLTVLYLHSARRRNGATGTGRGADGQLLGCEGDGNGVVSGHTLEGIIMLFLLAMMSKVFRAMHINGAQSAVFLHSVKR